MNNQCRICCSESLSTKLVCFLENAPFSHSSMTCKFEFCRTVLLSIILLQNAVNRHTLLWSRLSESALLTGRHQTSTLTQNAWLDRFAGECGLSWKQWRFDGREPRWQHEFRQRQSSDDRVGFSIPCVLAHIDVRCL